MKTRSWATIDYDNLRHNVKTLQSLLPKGCEMYGVVKGNAYGNGAVNACRVMSKMGVHRFAVACLAEGVELRDNGIEGEILVLSYVSPEDLKEAHDRDIAFAIVSLDHAKAISDKAVELGITKKVHLALNTGMNRIGVPTKEFKDLMAIADLYKLPGLEFTGIFSHFCSADEETESGEKYSALQFSRYKKVVDYLNERGIKVGTRHICNSAGLARFPEAYMDAVRPGAVLWGYNQALNHMLDVKPLIEWKVRITRIETIDFGDPVSYGRHFVADKPTRVATLGIGYFDGFPRLQSNKGYMLCHGHKAKVLGNVCMDQMMIDVTDIPEAKVGDEVVILGKSGNLERTADLLGEESGTIMQEIMAHISPRVERYYLNLEE